MNKAAVHAYNRIAQPKFNERERQWEIDCEFSYEFTPSPEDDIDQIHNYTINLVAEKFGIRPHKLEHDIQEYFHREQDKFMESIYDKTA
jgi:hypothetical protein